MKPRNYLQHHSLFVIRVDGVQRPEYEGVRQIPYYLPDTSVDVFARRTGLQRRLNAQLEELEGSKRDRCLSFGIRRPRSKSLAC